MEAVQSDAPAASAASKPPQQLSADQEDQILAWASKQRASGTVLRKELIHWFAEGVIRRDGDQHGVASSDGLAPDFVDGFVSRHPELAEKLVAVPQPTHVRPKVDPTARVGGLERLKRLRQADARIALFGDDPPPDRQPAPYPEGEIIYRSNVRYVVRHGDTITKYTTSSNGLGAHDCPNEVLALRFIKEHTTIPVPEVVNSDWDRITMKFIEGQTLQQAWPVLSLEQRSEILTQLSGYISQLRAMPGIYLGRLDGQGIVVPSIFTRSGGPFYTMAEFHDWLVKPPRRLEMESMYWHQITIQLSNDCPIVFTHGDIAARNILVRDGRIVALLDWEFAGWAPDYWEYVFAIPGMDKVDWETLGRYSPSLFAQRYDLEYILVGFILTIS